jgi:hypothetical protein
MDRLSNVAPLHGRRHQRSKILCAVACSLVGDGEEWFEPRPFVLCVDAPSVAGPIIEGLAAVGLNRRDKGGLESFWKSTSGGTWNRRTR